MSYWMDRSLDDDYTVLSVVTGCTECAVRGVAISSEEAMVWITNHQRRTHISGRINVKQIGDHLPRHRRGGAKDAA